MTMRCGNCRYAKQCKSRYNKEASFCDYRLEFVNNRGVCCFFELKKQ